MNVVLLLVRTRLRSSWRAALVLVLLIGLGGGVTLAVAAGVRRTASANDAILQAANAPDVATSYAGQHPDEMLPLLQRVPDVEGVSIKVGFVGRLEGQGVRPATVYLQGHWTDPSAIDRPFVTAGRLPTRANEVLLNEAAAARTGLGLGDKTTLALADASISEFGNFVRVGVDVVGMGLLAEEVIEDELGAAPLVLLSRGLTEQYLDRRVYGVVGLHLAQGDLAAVTAGLAGEELPGGNGEPRMVIERLRDDDRARVQTALRPLLGAFVGFGALAGTVTVVVAAQALGRMVRHRRVDDQTLVGVGCTRRQLVAVDVGCASTVAVGGVAVAVVAAALASPLFPVGPARRVTEVVGGVRVDAMALGVGAVCLLVAMSSLVGVSSWRRRSRPGAARPGRAPGVLGTSPARSTGMRLVTGRRGIRATVAGTAAGLAAVLATLTFTGSLDRLGDDADLVGMSWDVVARETFTQINVASVLATVQGDRTVRRVTGLGYTYGALNGTKLPGAQMSAEVGSPWPPISEGRAPGAIGEILVGRESMEALNLHIGDEVRLTLERNAELVPGSVGDPSTMTVTVVGSAVAPAVGQAGIGTARLDVGFMLSVETVEAIVGEGSVQPSVYLFDLASGADPQALIDRFPEGLPDSYGIPTEWYTSAVPAEVRQAEDARPVIWLGVGALAVAVVATIGHTLLGFVRQRRRDYAVLKALGFTRAEVRSTVLWQSGAVLGVALVGAVPVGVAAGRWLWIAFAQDLGILVRPVVPVLLLGAAVLVIALVVQGAALVPATLARGTPPGQTLRGE